MVYQALKEKEEELLEKIDTADLEAENSEVQEDIKAVKPERKTTEFKAVLNCLPTMKNGLLKPEFWRYYCQPWQNIFYQMDDPFNDLVTIIWGPRGGGKTISGVSISIIDGQMRGIPCISNVPFSWAAIDTKGNKYKIESIPFDQELFARGDPSLKYKRLLMDEGNYLADRLRSTSNKNLAMTDILQQARKFRMSVVFCTINWMWLDPRITGSLCDLLIECNDLYYKPFGKKNGLKKGHRLTWDIEDQSGKTSGKQFSKLCSTTFDARAMWNTYNTENFVDPREARKKLRAEQKMVVDQFGNEVSQEAWLSNVRASVEQLAQTQPIWEAGDFWDSLGIDDISLKTRAGRFLRANLGVERTRDNNGYARYDLSCLV